MCRSPPPPPPPRWVSVFRVGAMLSEILCQDCGSVVSITYMTYLVWCGSGGFGGGAHPARAPPFWDFFLQLPPRFLYMCPPFETFKKKKKKT